MVQNENKQAKNSIKQTGVGSGNYIRTTYKPKTFVYAGIRILESKKESKEFEQLKEFVKMKAVELGLR